MYTNINNISEYLISHKCTLGIHTLEKLLENNAKDNRNNCINAMVNILTNNSKKILKQSLNLKYQKEKNKNYKNRSKEKSDNNIETYILDYTKDYGITKSNNIYKNDIIYLDNELSNYNSNNLLRYIRNDCGSWNISIPNELGIPKDKFEKIIFDKYIEFCKTHNYNDSFANWAKLCEDKYEIPNSIIQHANNGCHGIKEALYRIRKVDIRLNGIPKDLILDILRIGTVSNLKMNYMNKNMDNIQNRARLIIGNSNIISRSETIKSDTIDNSNNKLSNLRNLNEDVYKEGLQDNISTSNKLMSINMPQHLFLKEAIISHKIKDKEILDKKLLYNKDSCYVNSQRYCNCDPSKLRELFSEKYKNINIMNNSNNEILHLWMGSYAIARNDKRIKGGEDGWFLAEYLQCMGVADGVGEWESLSGVSAREFSNLLMKNTLKALYDPNINFLKKDRLYLDNIYNIEEKYLIKYPSSIAKAALQRSLDECDNSGIHGASTALVMCFDNVNNIAGFANMGDSGALVLRRIQFDSGRMEIVRRVKEMQHDFNCPYQFARLPAEKEWLKLMKDGYNEIVKIAIMEKECKMNNQETNLLVCDSPEMIELLDVNIKEGDLIIIGTDGVFDNLFDVEISTIVGQVYSPYESKILYGEIGNTTTPMAIAKAIALSAYYKSLDPRSKTPFANQAKKHLGVSSNDPNTNSAYLGGKEDDITVLVAWVVNQKDLAKLSSSDISVFDLQ
ncbi:uncharacterized protein CMU_025350 [Cryptosporidium muris RN66]|uniref:Protein phosphatase n=1 Tax=Cryptosporidium muris (strain RN66) TaxID=441375 RepID=B6AAX7_CRYMR|nr:uncharacterized protein CMU_025350 [Cryptosporidium muris RN66]EEA05529.1 hypothetical protein, conserved [Cryptosporidium muris RN66]|eukprot:XP_002139878.1 hypothetical protein [Cryptosporidium muris RN66]